MRIFAWAFLAFYLACTPTIAQTPSQSVPSAVYSTPQELVTVDGARRINLYCTGAGAPTVILDAGAGDGALMWRRVQLKIGEFTRVCAYDRAGHGWSDPATRSSDVKNTVDDLHQLLNASGIATPIIYVGHSIAGLYGVYFAAKYPDYIAGMVLVDPRLPIRRRC